MARIEIHPAHNEDERWMNADHTDTVKYHAYLRKMTRYNPTRGGEQPFLR